MNAKRIFLLDQIDTENLTVKELRGFLQEGNKAKTNDGEDITVVSVEVDKTDISIYYKSKEPYKPSNHMHCLPIEDICWIELDLSKIATSGSSSNIAISGMLINEIDNLKSKLVDEINSTLDKLQTNLQSRKAGGVNDEV